MSNSDAQNRNQPKKFTRAKAGPAGTVNEKTAAWPGVPGKTGPTRSAGVAKVKTHPKSEGL